MNTDQPNIHTASHSRDTYQLEKTLEAVLHEQTFSVESKGRSLSYQTIIADLPQHNRPNGTTPLYAVIPGNSGARYVVGHADIYNNSAKLAFGGPIQFHAEVIEF